MPSLAHPVLSGEPQLFPICYVCRREGQFASWRLDALYTRAMLPCASVRLPDWPVGSSGSDRTTTTIASRWSSVSTSATGVSRALRESCCRLNSRQAIHQRRRRSSIRVRDWRTRNTPCPPVRLVAAHDPLRHRPPRSSPAATPRAPLPFPAHALATP